MRLIVGLGNPGADYSQNRHNIGFMALDLIAWRYGFGAWRRRFQGEVSEGRIAGQKVLALKPMTYMNESGRSVGEVARFYKLEPEDVFVLHDEIDLRPGKLRVKRGGGAGGHNGIRSIDAHLGPDYWRLRMGVGHPGEKARVKGHVLRDFAKDDQAWLDKFLDAVSDELPLLLNGDDGAFMSRVAHLMAPPKPAPKPAPKSATKDDPGPGPHILSRGPRAQGQDQRWGFNCGIVGLPNVGKSTLFNALTETAQAEAANYPFCTIEPNTGRVPVPDPRLEVISGIAKSAETIPTFLEFVDIAGLVRGASTGEGLGNRFLANIREVDAIVHVLRCFEGEATHVDGSVDPLRDAETVETELMLADLESVERQLETAIKRARGADKEAKARLEVLGAGRRCPARRQAGPVRFAEPGAAQDLPSVAAAERQAGALCCQRR